MAVVLLVVAAVAGLHYATQALKGQVEQALGPQSEVGDIAVGWASIEIHRVRIRAPQGWPAPDVLRAQRIVIVPDLRGLLSAQVRLKGITVDDAYVSMLRARDGRLRVVPSLTEAHANRRKREVSAAPGVDSNDRAARRCPRTSTHATVRQPPH